MADNLVSLKTFGAVGDGTTDDTVAIQSAIDSRQSLFIPSGKYLVTSTLVFPITNPMGGFRFEGEGRSSSDVLLSTRQGPVSSFIWGGNTSDPMFIMRSMVAARWANVSLVGQQNVNSPNKSAILVHVTHENGDPGSGSHIFDSVDFQRATVGIQFGSNITDTNCDTTTFRSCQFHACDTGFLSVNNQALGFMFDHCFAAACRRVIVMQRGGDITINGLYLNGCGGTGVDDWCMDFKTLTTSSNTVIINGLRYENATKRVLRAAINGKVSINGVNEAQSNQNTRMFWVDGSSLHMSNFRLVTNAVSAPPFYVTKNVSGGFLATLLLSRGRFEASQFTQVDWIELGGPVTPSLRIDTCEYGATGVPLPNVCNVAGWM